MNVRLLAAVALLAAVGCATSAQFQYAASVSGRHLADEAQRYATRDASLDATVRSGRLSAATALRGASATTRVVTAQGTYDAWSAVAPWLRSYLAADPRLSARARTVHLTEADRFDALIAVEARRPFGASTRPAAGR